jgi:hypothetical protein
MSKPAWANRASALRADRAGGSPRSAKTSAGSSLFGSQVTLLFAGAYQDLLSGLTGSVAPLSKLIYKCHETALSDISVAASGKAY